MAPLGLFSRYNQFPIKINNANLLTRLTGAKFVIEQQLQYTSLPAGKLPATCCEMREIP